MTASAPRSLAGLLLLVAALPGYARDDDADALAALRQAETYRRQGKYAQAVPLYEKAVAHAERVFGADDLNTAKLQNNLAELYRETRQYARAEPLYRRSLRTRETKLGPDHLDVAGTLNNLGLLHRDMGQYAEAEKLLLRSVRLKEAKLAKDDFALAMGLHNLARLYEAMKQPGRAAPLYDRSQTIAEAKLGPDDNGVIVERTRLGRLHRRLGHYARAGELLRRNLEVVEAKQGRDHPDTATCLHDLAELYTEQGAYDKGETFYLRSLAIRKARLGPRHPETALNLRKLAGLYEVRGQYNRAEPLYREALAIVDERRGSPSADLPPFLHDLAQLYLKMGQFDKADPLCRRAVEVAAAVFGPDHPNLTSHLDLLARLYWDRGNPQRARPLLERALKLAETGTGPNSIDVAVRLHNLGELERETGQPARARPLFERSLRICEPRFEPTHPYRVNNLNSLALVAQALGQYDQAAQLHEQCLGLLQTRFGPDHPLVASSRTNLALTHMGRARWDEAARVIDQARRGVRRYVRALLPGLSEREQLQYLQARYDPHFQGALSLALARRGDAGMADRSAGWVLNGKAVAHQALAERVHLEHMATADPKQAADARRLLAVREQLAALALAGPAPGQEAAHRRRREKLDAEEQELAKRLGRADGWTVGADPWVNLERVRAALPENAVLIEIARTYVFPVRWTNKPQLGPPRYLAWVIPARGHGDVTSLDLGEAARIEEAVRAVRRAVEAAPAAIAARGERLAERDFLQPLEVLSSLVLRPLLAHAGSAEQWIISPDAALWLVPWEALPLPGGRYALEDHAISYVVSGRDLVTAGPVLADGRPLLMADPDYDLDGDRTARKESGAPRPAGLAGVRWPRLPGTAAEARAIAPRLARYAGGEPEVRTGPDARESTLKAVHRPRALVLATHGFVLAGSGPAPERWDYRGVFIASAKPTGVGAPRVYENPLLRCGLVLAGANRREDGAGSDDGLLTGLEIVGTDLRGTDLVVLSACETGLGTVQDAEGVAGLRQAFQLAGARTVVATLWKIPDAETAQLMTDYFDHLAAGRGKAQALRRAQLDMIRRRRARHWAAHPLYWAAFTLTGDPGTARAEDEPPAADAPAPRPWLTRPAVLVPAAVALGLGAGWVLWRRRGRGVAGIGFTRGIEP